MRDGSFPQKKGLYVISVIGEDRVGIVAKVTQFLFKNGYTIVDIEQTVIHAQFTMVLLIRPLRPFHKPSQLRTGLDDLGKGLGMKITLTSLRAARGLRLAESNKPYVLTVLGPDRPGVAASFSSQLAKRKCNIEKIKMIARGELLAMEMWVDLREAKFSLLRRELFELARRIGVDMVMQPAHSFQKRKKVVIFDMDSTLVDAEMIDEMAKLAGVGKEIAAITAKGMRTKMDFARSLRKRVALLKGLSVKTLGSLARTLRLTRGSAELIGALKEMGFKVALITGGFTFFTEILKRKLGFDYAFGNELEIRKGRLTGRIKGRIIDAEGKARMMDEICRVEGITRDEVVAVGDGSNDRIMVANAGLGIAFNAKEILKKVADGALTRDHMKGILYCLGISEVDLRKS